MDLNCYPNSVSQLCQSVKAGLIRALCTEGLLTPSQRDELLRRQRTAQNGTAGADGFPMPSVPSL